MYSLEKNKYNKDWPRSQANSVQLVFLLNKLLLLIILNNLPNNLEMIISFFKLFNNIKIKLGLTNINYKLY